MSNWAIIGGIVALTSFLFLFIDALSKGQGWRILTVYLLVLGLGGVTSYLGYEKGQTDCLKGNIQYEMQVQPDTTFHRK